MSNRIKDKLREIVVQVQNIEELDKILQERIDRAVRYIDAFRDDTSDIDVSILRSILTGKEDTNE